MSSVTSFAVSVRQTRILPRYRQGLVGRLVSLIEFLGRVANATNYLSLDHSSRIRLSRTSAVLVGFYIFHAIPNYLLLSREGRRLYSYYCHINTNSVPTRLVEIFLGGALATHAYLGVRQSISSETVPLHRNVLFVTGALISGLISMHLMDFRFTPFVPKVDKQVLDTLNVKNRWSKNFLYWLFVLSVAVHALKGVSSRAWLWRLGFRNKHEIRVLQKLSQALIIVATSLYVIPLTMDNPYSKKDFEDSSSPTSKKPDTEILIVRPRK